MIHRIGHKKTQYSPKNLNTPSVLKINLITCFIGKFLDDFPFFSIKILLFLNLQQVSQWTPDLIELEHKAKEKAKVLFFVMDSETRSSAGAIETAHIAGENIKPLVLVLHPYKQNQKILNDHISIG
jgi:hypothetical protein